MPKSNTEFWQQKFKRNVERDKKHCQELRKAGWRVIVVWQCELYSDTIQVIERVVSALLQGSESQKTGVRYADVLERSRLLQVADEKVQYRLQRECNDR